jgi:GntR family transcriptional repressor for pyruvate dehydrogenase complex
MRPRKVEDIVAILRLRIQGRAYERGERLPAERQLAPELCVARSTLRQVLAILMEEGYLARRLGVKGGWFVTDLAQPVAEWTESIGTNLRKVRDIIDYRIAVETRAAELAAVRRTEEHLALMFATVEDLDNAASFDERGRADRDVADRLRAIDDRFHRLIAEAADSPMVEEAVTLARAELFATETRSTYREIAAGLPRDHRRVLQAIAQSDPTAAHAAMEEHIRHGADIWLAKGFEGADAGAAATY